MQPFEEARGSRFGVLGVDALFLARALFFPEPGGAGVPIVDLAVEADAHLALDLVDLGDPARSHLVEVVGNKRPHGVVKRLRLHIPRKPWRNDRIGNRHALLARDGAAIEIGRGAAARRRSVFLEEQELKPLGNGPRLARAARARVRDRTFELEEELGLFAFVRLVNQHAALMEKRLEPCEQTSTSDSSSGWPGATSSACGWPMIRDFSKVMRA